MDVKTINGLLARGEIGRDEMWPHIVEMESRAARFRFEFSLDEIPLQPGLITIRGPRQYGKSTWLELKLRGSIREFGRGPAYCLNGDEIATAQTGTSSR